MIESDGLREAIPSAYNLISANRAIGYTLSSAIADIIDNSISAYASKIQILSPPATYPILKIVDNGQGMDQTELDVAMKFGGNRDCLSKRSAADLGRFGMGLKTATLSQCKCLSVVTRKNGKLIGGRWDLDFLKTHDMWEYQTINVKESMELIEGTILEENPSMNGTAVIWEKFDRLSDKDSGGRNNVFAYELDKAINKLELIFHRFLSGEEGLNKVSIEYNGNSLEPNDPFLISKYPDYSKPRDIPLENDFIRVYPHKLPHPKLLSKEELSRLTLGGTTTLLESQGFYVYRAKRLIDYGTWFSLAPKLDKTKLSRIQIDIPNSLDHIWSLDIKKSRTILPQTIRNDLKNIVDISNDNSIHTFTRKARVRKESYPVWIQTKKDKTVQYTINTEHPMFYSFQQVLPEEQKLQFSTILKFISSSLIGIINQIQIDFQNDLRPTASDEDVDYENNELKLQIKTMIDLGIDDATIAKCFNFEDLGAILVEVREGKWTKKTDKI